MSYKLALGAVPYRALVAASRYVRDKYDLPLTKVIHDCFEREFNVIIHNSRDILDFDETIEFESEAAYLFFVLRWS